MDWSTSEMLLLGLDVDDFSLEKNIKPQKSPDEIEKLYVDEKLSDFDRVSMLLGSQYDVQKIWAIRQIVSLLKTQEENTITKLVPKVNDVLQSNDVVDIHNVGSEVYSEVARDGLVESAVFVTNFLPTIMTHFESKNTAISSIWLDALLTCIPTLPKDILKHKILPVSRARGQLSRSVTSRQNCCRIITKITGNLETYWVKQELFPFIKILAQDVDLDVRQTMCRQFTEMAEYLGVDFSRTCIFPEVEELARDEEIEVRCVAMETMAYLTSLLDEESKREKVIPLVLQFFEEALTKTCNNNKEIQVRTKACKLIGQVCHTLKDLLSPEQGTFLLDIFTKLAQTQSHSSPLFARAKSLSSPQTEVHATLSTGMEIGFSAEIDDDVGAECRRLCAYNMPAMILFGNHFNDTMKLLPIIKLLTKDDHWKVRRTLACGFHELVGVLKEESHTLTKDYGTLLRDNNIEVLFSIVEHIPEVTEVLALAHNLDPKTRQPGLLELISPLLHTEQVASTCLHWRFHINLLEKLSCLTKCMTSDQLYGKFIPLLWKCIGNNAPTSTGQNKSTTYAFPVKLAASKTLCLYISYIKKSDLRREICSQFITHCAHSDSYKQRLLFLDICNYIFDLFSKRFFKDQGLYTALLNLAKDPTMDIRLRVCSLLPKLKTVLLLPIDREYQQQFESAIATLLMDQESEIISATRTIVDEMDKINYKIQSILAQSFLEEDIIDKEKEEQERQLLRDEEEAERERQRSNPRLGPDSRRSAPISRAGGHSPNTSRATTGKLTTGKASIRAQYSPSVPRKASNLTISSTSSAPNSPRVGNKAIPSSSLAVKKQKGSTTPESIKKTLATSQTTSTGHTPSAMPIIITSDDKVKSGASSSKRSSGSPNLGQAGTAQRTVTGTRSKDHVSSSTTSKSSPGQSSKRTTSQYGLSYATKPPPKK